ncbi:MFS general substrate transporter [Hypoxylon crocopeplum]|nr:MFS general substrate transporter [Hypoxylon crocopeplum]
MESDSSRRSADNTPMNGVMDAEKATLPRPISPLNGRAEAQERVEEQAEEQRKITGVRWFLFVVSTLTSIFIYSLDNTIVANIVPTIVNDLNGVSELAWLSVGFTIGGMAMVLPFGKLYNIYDSKWVYIYSTIVFMASSALCGAAPNMQAEIVGRVFAGAGGNGMYFGLIALLSIHTTVKERPQYLSYTGLCWGLGTVLGPVVGGGFALWQWRWGFYINLLFGAVLMPMYLFIIPSAPPMTDKTQLEKLKLIDWIGWIISLGAMVTIIMAINLAGVLYEWNSGQIIALFVVSGVLWILFLTQQHFCFFTTKEHRLLPTHLFFQRMPTLLFFAAASVAGVAYVSVYYIPLYFQFTRGDSAIYTAVRLLPYICPLIVMMPTSGAVLSRWGYYKPVYIVGATASLITSCLLAHYVGLRTAVGSIYAIEVFLGGGTGFYTQSSFAVIQSVMPPSESGNGLALMMIAQLSGMTFGLAISGAIFVNLAQNGLYQVLPDVPREQVNQLVAGTSGGLLQTFSPEVQDAALDVIVSAWSKIFIVVYVGAAVSLLCAIFFKNGRANRSYEEPDSQKEAAT